MIICTQCKKEIISKNKTWLKRAKYCSHSCRSKHLFSGVNNPFFGKTHTIENREKISKAMTKRLTGKRSLAWKGGKAKDSDGYIKIYIPIHPYAVGGYVKEHRLVAEKIVGRFLKPTEIVHHINGKRNDNRIENLVVMTLSEHTKLHHLGRRK